MAFLCCGKYFIYSPHKKWNRIVYAREEKRCPCSNKLFPFFVIKLFPWWFINLRVVESKISERERDSGMSVTLWKWMHWTGHNTNRNDIASRLPFRRVVHTNLLLVQTVFFFSLHCVRSALDIKFALFLSLCATSRALYLFVQIIQKSSAPFYERGNYLVRCHFYLF